MKPIGQEMADEKMVRLPPVDRRISKFFNFRSRFIVNIEKKTVIFDLDETLIHCNQKKDYKCDV